MIIEFDTRGNKRQKDCAAAWLDASVLEILYGGSKGSGKSFLGVSLIFGDALMYPGTMYFIARKKLNDLRKFTIPSIKEVFQLWGLSSEYYTFNAVDNYYTLYNGSVVYLIDAKHEPSDPEFERFGSMQMTRGWIEEGGEFTQAAKNNLQASIGRWKNDVYKLAPKLLITCNPSKNFLYSLYYKPFKAGSLPKYRKFIQALPTDNKCLPDGYLLNLERTLSKTQKERLLYGNWEYDSDPAALIEYDAITDLFTNTFVPIKANNYISSDLATRGRDLWVTSSWSGFVGRIEKASSFSQPKEMEAYIRALAERRKVARSKIVADSDGLGQWLGSYMPGIYEFRNGSKAIDSDKYANLKAECAFKLAEKINRREMRLICTDAQRERIISELEVLKEINLDVDTQRFNIIAKDDMKALLGHSPDYLDNLIMRMVFEVKPTRKGITRMTW